LIAFAKRFSDSRQRPNRDRMVAAQRQRQLTCLNDLFCCRGEFGAGRENFIQILQFLAFAWISPGPVNADVAAVVDFISKLRDLWSQTRNARGRWSKLNAQHALAKCERRAEDADGFACAWRQRVRI